MPERIPQSVAKKVTFRAFLASDGKTPATGKTIAITISKNGGAFGNPNAGATNATEISSGFYKFDLDTTDTGTLGPLVWRGAHADINDAADSYTVADPYNAGFTGVPGAPPFATGGLAGHTLLQTIADRIGAFTGTGVNTILGFFKSLLSKSASTPSDVGGTFDATTDSTEAIRDYTAPASTALSTAQWSNARALYLDNLNVGGAVASQADINALNQSASRRVILTTVGQYERPESGSTTYTVEARTFDGDGAAANADTTPTLTATGSVSGSLAANLSAATNPATGVYRWTYTVANNATQEQIRFDISATMSTAFTLSVYTQVVDLVAATWTTTDRSMLTAAYNKLPSRAYLTGTDIDTGEIDGDDKSGYALNAIPFQALLQPFLTTLEGNIRGADSDDLKTLSDQLDGVDAKTTNLPAQPAAVGSQMALTSDYDLYHADVQFTVDEANVSDEYTVTWFKNGARVTGGITVPLIQVARRSNGTDLIASTAMSQIGTTGSYKYDEATNRLAGGEAALVLVGATIDGSARTFSKLVARDSTA